MIQVLCPTCGARLNAKEKLAGQTRKCPQCGGPVAIPAPSPEEFEATVELVDAPPPEVPIVLANEAESLLPSQTWLARLDRQNRYVICDKTSVVATWQNNGRGWMIRLASGFSPARRNREVLPMFGQFVLVEFVMESTDQGLRLAAVESYRLASRMAMTKLDLGDDEIVQAVTDRAGLNRDQKNAVRQILRDFFMREVWGGSREVLDYLANADGHSPSSRASRQPSD